MFITIVIFCNFLIGIIGYAVVESENNTNYKHFIYLGISNIIVSIVQIFYIYLYLNKKDYLTIVAILLIVIGIIFNIVILIYTQNNKIINSVSRKDRKNIVMSLVGLNFVFSIVTLIIIYVKLYQNKIIVHDIRHYLSDFDDDD
jgi:carbon starvation protein CstA